MNTPEVMRLIEVMRAAPKPLLIHCQGGADRTGLALALYAAVIDDCGAEAAEWQLPLRYGHISVPGPGRAWPMDQTWEAMEPLIAFTDS